MHVFEIYPIRHQDKTQTQLWQWRLKYDRETMCCGVEMGPGGRHGYASKAGALSGLRLVAKVFGLSGLVANALQDCSTRAGTYKLRKDVKLVIRPAPLPEAA